MAIISWSRGYLFLQAPRTACTAVASGVLIPHLDGEHFPPEHIYDDTGRRIVHAKHAHLAGLLRAGLLTPRQADGLLKFTTVRNPFDREVSLYTKMRSKEFDVRMADPRWRRLLPADAEDAERARRMDFPDWLEHRFGRRGRLGWRHDSSRRPLLTRGGHVIGADFVMRFERLQADFDEVVRRLGVTERYEIPVRNVTPGRDADYRSYYTAQARRIIEEVFRHDIERFGYEF